MTVKRRTHKQKTRLYYRYKELGITKLFNELKNEFNSKKHLKHYLKKRCQEHYKYHHTHIKGDNTQIKGKTEPYYATEKEQMEASNFAVSFEELTPMEKSIYHRTDLDTFKNYLR